jgi:hypothetical protein
MLILYFKKFPDIVVPLPCAEQATNILENFLFLFRCEVAVLISVVGNYQAAEYKVMVIIITGTVFEDERTVCFGLDQPNTSTLILY